jgi:hypothetical protein
LPIFSDERPMYQSSSTAAAILIGAHDLHIEIKQNTRLRFAFRSAKVTFNAKNYRLLQIFYQKEKQIHTNTMNTKRIDFLQHI